MLWGCFGSKKENNKFINSSSSTNVFNMLSTSQVKISQAMKGNLNVRFFSTSSGSSSMI
uniref:Uncharacterized protein n=1 Tax=Rhizophora mucronata TaxID=61149 RepID=A0A2P2M4Q3_RHIMU